MVIYQAAFSRNLYVKIRARTCLQYFPFSTKTRASFQRLASPSFRNDFSHHDPHVARLNHGSFGATPTPVIKAEENFRSRWRANPDAFYFGQVLDQELLRAAKQVQLFLSGDHLQISSKNNINAREGKELGELSVALVENATVAVASIARRWASQMQNKNYTQETTNNKIMCLDVAYKAVEIALRQICGHDNVEVAHITQFEDAMALPSHYSSNSSFTRPQLTDDDILKRLEVELYRTKPSYVMLEHVSSQPAIRFPLNQMVQLCKEHNVKEIAVDGAHAIGMVDINIKEIDADFYFTNLHKWAFAAGPTCALHMRSTHITGQKNDLLQTPHAIPSWRSGEGIISESQWTGTRDYAATASIPEALKYLQQWRSADGYQVQYFNKKGCHEALQELREAWNVNDPNDPAVADLDYFHESMGMIRLPPQLKIGDAKPGQPSGGVRKILREKYGIEAALGDFGKAGGFIRLSHAVYNTDEDIRRLRNAVFELSR